MTVAQSGERMLEEILSHIPTAILTTDNKLKITSFNERFAPLHLLNIKKDEEIINRDICTILPLKSSVSQLLRKLLKGEVEKVETIYNPVAEKDAPVVKMIATLLKDKKGEPKGIVMLCEDISELKNLEQQLIQSSKMAVIGEMAAMFVHEMRNPITGIYLATEVLKIKCSHDESVLDTISDIELTARKIEGIISRIMNFAKLDLVSFSKSSIEDLVNSSLEFVSSYLTKYKVRSQVQVESNLPPIYLDKVQIIQVLVNLIKNACKAMESKGGGTLEIILDKRQDSLRIRFTDQGKGMDEKEIQHAFRPFYSNFNEGTGLGLSIAQRIVELHRGRILIESKPNKGSTFTVELPVQLKSE
jgi:two-component system, sporulation sensor kinase E